ncbi:MAG TPA: nicotinamidase [Candidatus Acidoferrales bacterium]|nr:nicotinamidase [Candidatus Acidoferrales bacterium]
MTDALLIVDPQLDFCPGGALPVAAGDRIFAPLNRIQPRFETVVASRDWHPADHVSFRGRGGQWPDHCVRDSPGAQFHSDLDTSRIQHVVNKGTDPDAEAYSAFDGTGLAEWLRGADVTRLFVAGLATDYCVLRSVIDAIRAGFEVFVISDCIAAVDLHAGDGERAIAEMKAAGAKLVTESEVSALKA